MIKKIKVEQLKVGMYVSQLDRNWLETPFLSHKFEITTPKQLTQLKEYCSFVYIDTEKGLDFEEKTQSPKIGAQPVAVGKTKPSVTKSKESPSPPQAENFQRALEVHDQAKTVIEGILEDVRIGRIIPTTQAKNTVKSLITSLIDDKNALLSLTKLRGRDEYTVTHSINVGILSLAFGQRLGIDPEKLELLGLGALLHDIGKMKVPLEILNKPGKLSETEFEIMKKHVLYSVERLKESAEFPRSALNPVLHHHERTNGKGYPFGLQDNQISFEGKIVAIVDVYDAMSTARVYKPPVPPHEALKLIYEWSSTDFDKQLVEQFIKTIGIFPIGSQVEINHSDIGIVISTNPDNNLKPTVLLLYDRQREEYKPPRLIDLTEKELFTNKIRWTITKVFGPLDKKSFDGLWEKKSIPFSP